MYVKLTMGNEIVEGLGIHWEESSNSFDVTGLIKVGNCKLQRVLRARVFWRKKWRAGNVDHFWSFLLNFSSV